MLTHHHTNRNCHTHAPARSSRRARPFKVLAPPCSSAHQSEHTHTHSLQTDACTAQEQEHSSPPSHIHSSRRAALLSTSVLALSGVQAPEAAQALKTIELPNGEMASVYEHGMSLAIVALRGSVPQQWVMDFKTSLGKYSGFTLGQRQQLEDIYKDLSDPTSKNSAGAADVVTLGDAWLAQAIRDKLVQPISNAESYRWWRYLSPRWRKLVRRNASGYVDPNGQVYGAPYRWGATLIAYRKDRLLRRGGHPILDWSDLLQPQLQGRVAVTASSRELLGLALKTLGVGYNPSVAELEAAGVTEEVLAQRLHLIRKQVKLFNSNDHVRALQAGDVWAIVGWSQDLVTLAERSNSVEAIVPASGTSLFADLWVVPKGAQGGNLQTGPSPLLPSWLEFGLMPARVPGHPGLKVGAAPVLLPEPERMQKAGASSAQAKGSPADAGSSQQGRGEAQAEVDAVEKGLQLRHGDGYMPSNKDALRGSEFLLPLEPAIVEIYRKALSRSEKNAA